MNDLSDAFSVKVRLFVIMMVAIIGMSFISIFALKTERTALLEERKVKIRHSVEATSGILQYYYDLQKNGLLSEEDAKKLATATIKNMRYGNNDYFWINDFSTPIAKMIMHPTVPALDGKVLDAKKFSCATSMQAENSAKVELTDGKTNLFVAANEITNRAGGGYITYNWPKPKAGGEATKELYSKLSYVHKFAGWNWLIGSGIYIDDIDTIFWERARFLLLIVAAATAFIGILIFILSQGIKVISDKLASSNSELEKVNGHLQELDRLKSDFLSSVSHELRTPLTSIRGFSKLIDREFERSFAPLADNNPELLKKRDRINENIKIIFKESERLTRLINDVLDLAKIEAGHDKWDVKPIQAEAVVKDAANMSRGNFEQNSDVKLCLEIDSNIPQFIGNADRMQQVLINLINNASKFTDKGSVTIKAFTNPKGHIQIEVHDTGIGFLQEEAEAIFDKFQQAKQGDTLQDRPKGTGLGLAICKEIVHRHGGRIWASSTPGEGSIFCITLPPRDNKAETDAKVEIAHKNIDKKDVSEAQNDKNKKYKVLVVDDDDSIRNYFVQLLSECGYEVTTAINGQMALESARQNHPDLITMDLSMPVMDGHTAISILHSDENLKHIPIIVVSALPEFSSSEGDVAMCKPLDEALFIKNVQLLLKDNSNSNQNAKIQMLALYDNEQMLDSMHKNFADYCNVTYCTLEELTPYVENNFNGLVAIPYELLNKIDLTYLTNKSSLEVMILSIFGGTIPLDMKQNCKEQQ